MNTTGLVVASSWEVDVRDCLFTGLDIGMMINGDAEFNNSSLNLPSAVVQDSEFRGNALNVYAIETSSFRLIRARISGGRLGVGAFETRAVTLEDCTIRGYGQPSVNEANPSQQNSLAGAIVLDHVTTLTMKGGQLLANDTGIYGCKRCQITRIGIINGAVIQGNRVGVEMYGGTDGDNGLGYGGLKVDCSSIIGNSQAGVYGHDILLAIESVRGSNNFDHGAGESKIFNIRYFDYDDIGNTVPAKDNVWGEDCPMPTQDYILQKGYDGESIRLELGDSCTDEIPCGEGDDGGTTPSPDDCPIRVVEPNIVQTVHEVTLIGYEQFWYEENESVAMKTLAPVASLPSKEGSDRLTGRCWQNVYLAQLIVNDKKGKAGYISRDERNLTEINKTKIVSVFPNPASTDFSIDVPQGNYTIEIYNALGQAIIQQQIFETINIQTDNWKSGVYFIRVFDNTTKQFFEEKLIVE